MRALGGIGSLQVDNTAKSYILLQIALLRGRMGEKAVHYLSAVNTPAICRELQSIVPARCQTRGIEG